MSERSRWERCSTLLYYLFVRTIRNVQQCPTCRRSIPYVPFAEPETALPATIGSATRLWVSAGRSRGQRPSGPPASFTHYQSLAPESNNLRGGIVLRYKVRQLLELVLFFPRIRFKHHAHA